MWAECEQSGAISGAQVSPFAIMSSEAVYALERCGDTDSFPKLAGTANVRIERRRSTDGRRVVRVSRWMSEAGETRLK